MRPLLNRLAREDGFTLVTALVMMGLLLILVAGTMSAFRIVHATAGVAGRAEELDRIANTLNQTLRSPIALQKTYLAYSQNQFHACLEESGRPDCQDASKGLAPQWAPLSLRNSVGDVLAGPVGQPPNSGQRYTLAGTPCAKLSVQCPLIAYAFFVPSCPSSAPYCDRAASFELSYWVGVDPAARRLFKLFLPLKPRTGTVIVETRAILNAQLAPPTPDTPRN